MEAIRRICRGIQTRDFWARMPEYVVAPDAEGNGGVTVGLTGLSNRQEQFRFRNGLVSWTGRGGSDQLKEAVSKKLSQQDRANNTTRNFRGLTRTELNNARAANKESAASKSKSKTHQERIAREKREKEEREKRAKQNQKQQVEEDGNEYGYSDEDQSQQTEEEDDGDNFPEKE